MAKKRHHFVPKAYLKFFCAKDGKLHVYLKDDPRRPFRQAPGGTAFHKHYYSQPLPTGGNDHDALEDFFSDFEVKWPPLVERMLRRENVNDALGNIVQFVALQRIRVPALRDAAEHMAAARLKSALMQLDAMDELPCQPEGHPDILYNVEFVIDPHQSIHSMPTFVEGMAAVLDRVGIGILHNVTDVPFITSDNPVAYFDPRCSVEGMLPYTIDRSGGPVVLCFPIAPRLMLYGHSSMRDQFARHGLLHGDIAKKELVELMNQQTSRFAYRAVIADRPGFENLVQQFSHESPIVKSTIMRQGPRTHVEHRSVFGKGESKPKWEANRAGR